MNYQPLNGLALKILLGSESTRIERHDERRKAQTFSTDPWRSKRRASATFGLARRPRLAQSGGWLTCSTDQFAAAQGDVGALARWGRPIDGNAQVEEANLRPLSKPLIGLLYLFPSGWIETKFTAC